MWPSSPANLQPRFAVLLLLPFTPERRISTYIKLGMIKTPKVSQGLRRAMDVWNLQKQNSRNYIYAKHISMVSLNRDCVTSLSLICTTAATPSVMSGHAFFKLVDPANFHLRSSLSEDLEAWTTYPRRVDLGLNSWWLSSHLLILAAWSLRRLVFSWLRSSCCPLTSQWHMIQRFVLPSFFDSGFWRLGLEYFLESPFFVHFSPSSWVFVIVLILLFWILYELRGLVFVISSVDIDWQGPRLNAYVDL